MATTAMNKPKIEQGEEVEAEATMFSTQIPDDREALLEFMDQRAKSIQRLKDQISSFDRKVSSFFFALTNCCYLLIRLLRFSLFFIYSSCFSWSTILCKLCNFSCSIASTVFKCLGLIS